MEKTLVLLKPSCVDRGLIGEVVNRLEKKGLIICGMKMIQLDEKILREHYAHLVDRPFFPVLAAGMMATPVVAMCLKGLDAVEVVRKLTGSTNGRKADPGTIRGDLSMSGSQNIIHASDSPENAEIEIKRFFRPEEIFDYMPAYLKFLYSEDEL
ncbi:MAG: nucleoside-diphosphate kinase [Muribaculaceae bacterium]|nr:nucleoside-diphosphate kinase [Muribaculaceae bacterium]